MLEHVLDFFEELPDHQQITIWNNHCDNISDSESYIYANDEETWNMMYLDKDPYDIVRDIAGDASISLSDNYVVFKYNGPETFNNINDIIEPSEIFSSCQDINDVYKILDEAGVDYSDLEELFEENE